MLLSVLNMEIPLGNVVLHCTCTIHSIKYCTFFPIIMKSSLHFDLMKVQTAFDRERSSENYFSDGFDITGDMRVSLDHDSSCVCCRLDYGMVWNHSVTTKTACVRSARTLLTQATLAKIFLEQFLIEPFQA